MASKNTVVGLTSSHEQAENIVNELQRAGFSSDDVSALFPDQKGTRDFAHEKNTRRPKERSRGRAPVEPSAEHWGCWLVLAPWPFRASVRSSRRDRSWRR